MRRGNGKTDVNIDLRDQGLRDDLRGVDSGHELPAADGADESPQGAVASKAAEVVSGSEIEKLKAERDALLDRLARLQAEFENARKRAEKEKADFKDFALGSVVEQFLPVVDNFELALKSTGSLEQLRTGVELIVKQMDEALRSLNVQPVESVGAQFDPRVHEALGSIETVEYPDHQVLEEIRRGYKLREKLLRPALVRIADNSAQKSE